ncbi:MAG: thioesterase family protein [Planctomycetota bacterium]
MTTPVHAFVHRRRVEFYETDMAGMVHFSVFFRYMEACEHAFVRSLGGNIHPGEGGGEGSLLGWPRVHASCDYQRPLRYDEEIDVRLLVREKRERAVHYDFRFHRIGDTDPRPLATGKLVVVPVARIKGVVKSIPLPAFTQLIAVAPADLLDHPTPRS